jgi:RNA polymerase sigma-19 factor, ECF subfamily
MNSNSLPDILKRAANNDETAFREIFLGYWPQVYGTSLKLTKSRELAKDLAQEIFVKLWDNRLKLGDVKNLEAYLFTLSKNYVIDYLRKKVLDTSNAEFLEDYFSDEGMGPDRKLELKEMESVLHEAVKNLTPQLKQVFSLHRFEGLNHEQIAARLNISKTSSKTYVVRALAEIRKYIETHAGNLIFAVILALFFFANKF